MASNRYCIEVAPRGTAGCKNCKQKIDKGLVRIAKIVPNPFTEAGGDMKNWYHVRCIFETLSRARATTKKIDGPEDLEGWDQMEDEYKDDIIKLISEFSVTGKKTPQKTPKKADKTSDNSPSTSKKPLPLPTANIKRRSVSPSDKPKSPGKDDSFREFRRLCAEIANEPKYTVKTSIISEFFKNGSKKDGFDGDLYLWVKMLLPMVDKRVYNIQSKQIVKLFSQIFGADQKEMLNDLDEGDVAETINIFFGESDKCPPLKKSSLTLQDIDAFLDDLSRISKEDEQQHLLLKVTKRCTANDLKMFVRFIKHDLRINAGPKHVLEALHAKAYPAFQASRNLKEIVRRFSEGDDNDSPGGSFAVQATLMTPVLPMLAQACPSADFAFKKCPDGLFVEIKYDGERVQIHKEGDNFSYFSRSLKPVMSHKISHFKNYVPQAFPQGDNLILDSEILLVDKDGKPLPFGTLGAHKKAEFQDANVCLFIFDCLQFNDNNLMNTPLIERRRILQKNMTVIKNHILLSEQKYVEDPDELKQMMKSVVKQGLEGLVIKGKNSTYEPGKRHWLKMKKDYLKGENMADSADLNVLGAYYGTGQHGGKMSIFLMGCLNKKSNKWCTVTKVHGGHTDAMLSQLQKELKMDKISKDMSKVPSWLHINKSLVPDFVIKDPKESQVWEITGAEFTKTTNHTASGISIRFPRVTRIRDDKTWKEATNLEELQDLYKASKVTTDLIGLGSSSKKRSGSDDEGDSDDNGNDEDDMDDDDDEKDVKKSLKKIDKKRRSSSPTPKKSTEKGRKRSKSRSKSPPKKRSASPFPEDTEDLSPPQKVQKLVKDMDSNTKTENDVRAVSCNGKLPNVFTGVKMFLPKTIKDLETLKRYFVAFDGIVLKESDSRRATHVVTARRIQAPREIAQVTEDWLWDCIKLKKLIPHRMYIPNM